VHEYASAQFLDFLELAKNCTFLDRKLISALDRTADGHQIKKALSRVSSPEYNGERAKLAQRA
ncbi:MAG: hypothetical protein WAU34_14955, partial [Desulfobacterales bacterium]